MKTVESENMEERIEKLEENRVENHGEENQKP